MTAHWDYRGGLLQSRPDTEAFLLNLARERGLSTDVPTREEALAKLVYVERGPTITCPPPQTVPSSGGRPTPVTYPLATAGRLAPYAGPPAISCAPASGSEFPIGPTTVTCTVEQNRRSDSCTVIMRVLP